MDKQSSVEGIEFSSLVYGLGGEKKGTKLEKQQSLCIDRFQSLQARWAEALATRSWRSQPIRNQVGTICPRTKLYNPMRRRKVKRHQADSSSNVCRAQVHERRASSEFLFVLFLGTPDALSVAPPPFARQSLSVLVDSEHSSLAFCCHVPESPSEFPACSRDLKQ